MGVVEKDELRGTSPWIAAYLAREEHDDIDLRQLRGMSPEATRLAVRFPPGCVVKTIEGVSHVVPPLGAAAIVIGVQEPTTATPLGAVVVAMPASGIAALCLPDNLSVVGYRIGASPDDVLVATSESTA